MKLSTIPLLVALMVSQSAPGLALPFSEKVWSLESGVWSPSFGVTAHGSQSQIVVKKHLNNYSEDSQPITVRGRVVCLDERSQAEECARMSRERPARFGLRSSDGKLYRFLSTDVLTAMFTDERIRRNELQITARLISDHQMEIIKVQVAKEERLYDVHYYCEVCSITAYAPGPCACCGEEMEFIETPASESPAGVHNQEDA